MFKRLLLALALATLCVGAQAQTAVQLPPAKTCFTGSVGQTGVIALLGSFTPGTGGTNGTYSAPLLGGSGSGAIATIVVSGGVVTGQTLTNPGSGYAIGDVLTAAPSTIGGVLGYSTSVTSTALNGALAGGSAAFYTPSTTTPKSTWQDAAQTILNPNPVPLDGNGCALIYGIGTYRQIVKDNLGNTIWDSVTGAPSGSAGTNIGPLGSGHVFGNATGVSALGTDASLVSIMQQPGSGIGTGVATAASIPTRAAGGLIPLSAPVVNVGNTCGADYPIASGTYNSTTGAVILTLGSAPPGLAVGQAIYVLPLTGTGAYASLAGYYVSTAGTSGSTINLTEATGLGAASITSGYALVPTGVACVGGSTTPGLVSGNLAIGNFATTIDAFVLGNFDNFSQNPNQEMRGLNVTIRHAFDATHPDELGLGWDSIPVLGTSVIDASNQQDIHGNVKAVVAQHYFEGTTGHNYAVNLAYGFQSALYDLAPQATIAHYYGLLINGTPQNVTGGVVQQEIGAYIQSMTGQNVVGVYVGGLAGSVTATGIEIAAITSGTAAIKIDGAGSGNALAFPHTNIFEDNSTKLNLSMNSLQLVLNGMLGSTTATAGAAGALPGQVAKYWSVIDETGTARKIPMFNN